MNVGLFTYGSSRAHTRNKATLKDSSSMRRSLQIALFAMVLLANVPARAQASHDYIIAERRLGAIEFIDPATLQTLSTITVDVPPNSAGLNGIFLNPDGRTLYIDGPIGGNSQVTNACCWLYSIDLETLQAKAVAGIWGAKSRRALVNIGPGLMRPASETSNEAAVAPPRTSMPLPESSENTSCAMPVVTENFTAGNHLFVYEVFGSKIDRREHCSNISGGVWMLDPVTHEALAHFAPDLYFWKLLPNQTGSELYGITTTGAINPPPAGLVRIEAQAGTVLQNRPLDSDYWWLTFGSLQFVPSGNVSLPR